jgi:hypothetical protein
MLKKTNLKWQFNKDDSWAYLGKIVFINVVKKFVFVCQKAFFKHVHAAKRIGK